MKNVGDGMGVFGQDCNIQDCKKRNFMHDGWKINYYWWIKQ